MVVTTKSKNFDFYKKEVDRAIKDCGMWNDKVRLIVYTTIITETCDGRPFGWLNYTNPREPQFANFHPNDGYPPDESWSTQRSGGLFQQQPQFWGPDVMDPYKATTSFIKGFRFPDGRSAAGLVKIDWKNLPIHVACQTVQGSEFASGSNYNRNVPFAQMVLDAGEEMADYNGFDDALDRSQVRMGGDETRTESIRDSIAGTNKGIWKMLPGLLGEIKVQLANSIDSLVGRVADEILDRRRWAYWNQENIPEKDRGTNNLTESLFAINGRVYHPAWGNKALSDKLDLAIQIAQVGGNPQIVELVKKYNETHVAKVPVVEVPKNA